MDGESASLAVTLAIYVGLPSFVLFVGWLVGHLSEVKHERSLASREEALKGIETTGMRNPPGFAGAEGPCVLVSGEAVIASDAFKSWVFGFKNIGRDIAAGFKNMVGGELKGYTELLTESRREAITRMIAQAEALGANAVVNVRFSTSAITSGASEMMAYGTAVVAE